MNWDNVSVFFQAAVSLFAIVNPIGNLPVFLELTEGATLEERRRVFRLAATVAFGIVLVMAIGGRWILHDVFSLAFDEFRFAGGLIMAIVGILRIVEKPRSNGPAPVDPAVRRALHENIAITPIASPLLVGPGSIVVAMLTVNRFSNLWGFWGQLLAILAVVLAFATTAAVLHWAHWAYRLMGRIGALAVGRVMNIFIVAIGVHFIFSALRSMFFAGT